MTTALGTPSMRLGGSSIDKNWHFNVNNTGSTLGQQALFMAAHGSAGYITVNYGTASPQEAAAELAYLNGSTTDNTVIGTGEQWNATNSTWVDVDWGKVSDWAKLRAAAPLATDDGKNFLRLNHPASLGFHYWGVGNEIYGTWETRPPRKRSNRIIFPMPAGTTRAAHDRDDDRFLRQAVSDNWPMRSIRRFQLESMRRVRRQIRFFPTIILSSMS